MTALDFYDEVENKTRNLRERYLSEKNTKKTTSSLAIIGHFDTTK